MDAVAISQEIELTYAYISFAIKIKPITVATAERGCVHLPEPCLPSLRLGGQIPAARDIEIVGRIAA